MSKRCRPKVAEALLREPTSWPKFETNLPMLKLSKSCRRVASHCSSSCPWSQESAQFRQTSVVLRHMLGGLGSVSATCSNWVKFWPILVVRFGPIRPNVAPIRPTVANVGLLGANSGRRRQQLFKSSPTLAKIVPSVEITLSWLRFGRTTTCSGPQISFRSGTGAAQCSGCVARLRRVAASRSCVAQCGVQPCGRKRSVGVLVQRQLLEAPRLA